MGSEGFFATLGGMIFGGLVGLVFSLVLKLLTRRTNLPGWPILLFTIVGGMLPAVLQHWRYA